MVEFGVGLQELQIKKIRVEWTPRLQNEELREKIPGEG